MCSVVPRVPMCSVVPRGPMCSVGPKVGKVRQLPQKSNIAKLKGEQLLPPELCSGDCFTHSLGLALAC